MENTIFMNGQLIKITHCPPRKAKGASLPKRSKRSKGQIGANFLAKENGKAFTYAD